MNNELKPTLYYDGDCGFCRRWVHKWKHQTGDVIDYVPFGKPPHPSVELVMPSGERYFAAEAVFRSLALAGQWKFLLWKYQHIPGFAALSEWIYKLIAKHRSTASKFM